MVVTMSIFCLDNRAKLFAKKIVVGKVVSTNGECFSVCKGIVPEDFDPEKLEWFPMEDRIVEKVIEVK